ncbi:MAG: tRNA (guanosine(46)-N7)-methyltransferase TrmB [Opitutales bacterium]|nr:tRNA (guanosine(46)-N7)-methyltransferase TrmB [Opitutales bacterium]
MSDYAKALADREARICTLRKKIAAFLPEEVIGGFSLNGITLEIGCGHGHFLAAYAAAFPQEICMGLDLITKRIERANAKKEKAALNNVNFYKADANEFLEALPPKVTLEKIFLLYLDPWPKKRHHKNRIIQEKTLTAWAERSRPGAKLYFRTDHLDFYQWALEHVNAHPQWEVVPDEKFPFERETYFQSILPDKPNDLIARRL